jgi:hypothetical protein
MANEFVARNGIIALDNSVISGSLIVTNGITGSFTGTASYAANALSSSNSLTSSFAFQAANASSASNALSASFAFQAANASSASFATTASFAFNTATAASASFTTTSSFAFNASTAASASFATNAANATTASHAVNAVTSSFATQAANAANATTASHALNAVTASRALQANTASFATFASTAASASFASNTATAASASFATNASTAASASFATSAANATTASHAVNAVTASHALNAVTASHALNAVTASYIRLAASASNALSASYALNSSNATSASYSNFAITSSFASNAANASSASFAAFASTASNAQTLAPGTTVSASNIYVNNNLFVAGTASFGFLQTVTGSAVIIGEQYIVLNADTPISQFAGIQIYDTGSSSTASFEWNGVGDYWIGVEETGQSYGFLTGVTSSKGNEIFPVLNKLVKGTGYHGLQDSSIIDNGSIVSVNSNTQITGSLIVSAGITANLTGTSSFATSASFAGNAANAASASFATSTANATTASHAINAVTASFALNSQNAFVQGGNSFGAQALLGTNDTQNLAFETNGSIRMFISSSGNVGIGSTAPAFPLDVNGPGRFVSNNASRVLYLIQEGTNAGNIIQFQDQNKNNTWEIVGRDNLFYIYNAASASYALSINPTTSRVGLGTSTPAQNLHIYSSASVDNADIRLMGGGQSSVYMDVYYGASGGGLFGYGSQDIMIGQEGVGNFVYFKPGGNVGIGTSNPTSKLSIIGTGNFTGNVGINTTSLVNALTVGSPQRLDGGTNSLGATVIAGPISTGSNDFTFSSAILRIQGSDATNNLQFGVGNATYNFHPWIQGSFDNSAGSNAFGAKDILLNPLGGNVGINTSEPNQYGFSGQLLTVNGGTSYTNLILAGDVNSGIAFGTSTGRLGQITMDSSGMNFFSQGTGNGFTMIMNRSGNVGIGTTSPTSDLHVYDNSDVWHLRVGGASGQLRMGGQNGSGAVIGAYTPGDISRDLYLQRDGGNVGIGTTSPVQRLEVNGNIKTGTDNFTSLNGGWFFNGNGSYATGIFAYSTSNNMRLIAPTQIEFYTNDSVRILLNSSGNVGIATTAPVTRLHIGPETSIGTNTSPLLVSVASGSRPSILLTEFGFRSGVIGYTTSNYFAMASEEANAGNGIQFITRGNFSGTGGLLNNGRIAMTINNDGNVGVGTVTVNTKFHVFSNIDSYRAIRIQASASTGDAGIEFIGSGGNIFNIQQPGSTAGLFFYDRTNSSTRMTIDGNGNVGIGTTAPTADLHVYENNDVWHTRIGGASGELRIGGQNGSGAVIQAYTPGGIVRDLYIQRDGGNVGIGNTTPGYKLSIQGSAGIEQSEEYFYFNSTYVVGNNARGKIRAVGAGGGSGYGGDLRLSSRTSNNVWNEDALTIAHTGNVGVNVVAPAYKFQSNGPNGDWSGYFKGSSSSGNSYGMFIDAGTTSADSPFMVRSADGATTFLRILGNGNVGIGTTSPDQLLRLNGTAGQPGTTGTTQNGIIRMVGWTTGSVSGYGETLDMGFHVGISGPASYAWLQATNWSGLNINYNLNLNPNGGNVGVGTTTPLAKFHVNGEVRIVSSAAINTHLNYLDGGSNYISMANAGLTVFRNSSSDLMTILGGGNVGINTTAPVNKFQVVGADASFDGGSGAMRFYVNRAGTNVGSIIFTTGGPGTANGWAEIGQTDASGDLYFKANPSAGTFTNRMVIQGSSGNVGIGTITPGFRLDVRGAASIFNGSSNSLSTLYIQAGHQWSLNADASGAGSPQFAGSGFFIRNENTSTIALGFNTGGAATFISNIVTTGGCVGIGTTAPLQSLHVVGNVFVNDDDGTGNGIILGTGDRPLITRGWDPFTSGNKNGIGRWGVYMESAELFIGCPGTDYVNGLVTIGGWLVGGTRQPNLTVNNGTRRVGIGTDIPTHQLSINRATEAAAYQININSAGGVSTGNFTGIRFSQASAADTELGNIKLNYFTDGSTSLSLGTRYATSAILIESSTSGLVGIGSTAPAFKLDVNGPGRFVSNSSSRVLYLVQDATNAGNIIQFRNQSNTDIGEIVYRNNQFYIYSNAISGYIMYGDPATGNVGIGYGTTSYKLDVGGTIRATGDVIAYSDARVKDNVETVENALDKVKLLRGVTYTRKDNEDKSRKVGVIAQEVLPILPEVVQQDTEGNYSVAYGNMVGVLIEAIKEQQKQIDELKYLLQTQNK